jgi:hypothetical protein
MSCYGWDADLNTVNAVWLQFKLSSDLGLVHRHSESLDLVSEFRQLIRLGYN